MSDDSLTEIEVLLAIVSSFYDLIKKASRFSQSYYSVSLSSCIDC